LTDRWGRCIPDNTIRFEFDTAPPVASNVTSNFFGVIEVSFSEPIDESTAKGFNQYELVGIGNPININIHDDDKIILEFDDLSIDQDYQLVYRNISDISGNYNISDTILFTYLPPEVPAFGNIIITEIMADPSPAIGLPEIEYIEIYNKSDQTFDLGSMILTDKLNSIDLPKFDLVPLQYLALSGSQIIYQYNGIVVNDFPSLGNSDDSLVLSTVFGGLVDQVEYNSNWYRDPDKDDGGYSLELINPESSCPTASNWRASTADEGGTPGFQNSVYSTMPDSISPEIATFIFSETGIRIIFNEAMDSLSLTGGAYDIEGLNIFATKVLDDLTLEIGFSSEIEPGESYSMAISNVADCSGNIIDLATIEFGIGDDPEFNEILITEIMADPDPPVGLPNVEYLEIYNNSNRLLSLENLKIADVNSISASLFGVIASGAYKLLVPGSSVGQFEIENVIPVTSWVSLANGGEYISITGHEYPIFTIRYKREWYLNEDESDGGYSLEMGDLTNPCQEDQNWRGSLHPDGGTPGFRNSFTIDLPDNFGPNLERIEIVDPDSLLLIFDEKIDPFSIGNVIVFEESSLDTIQVDTILFSFLDPFSIKIHLLKSVKINFRLLLIVPYS